jgi:serine beta-lactamase-like protein LACTB, mitochondrial
MIRCYPAFALVMFVIGLTCSHAEAQQEARVEAIDARLRAAVTKQGLVGLAAAVVVDGQLLWQQGYGYASRKKKRPVDPQRTMFRWASISKPVTAVAALQLVEKRRLELHDTARSHVPEFPEKPQRILVRQLLGHQGGIVHYSNGPVVRTRATYRSPHPFESVILALDSFKESPLVAVPGQRFSYTTHGYILLSAIVERAGDAPFWRQVERRIARPAGMKSFRPDYQWRQISGRATGYRKRLGTVVESVDSDVSWKLGGGGFISTVEDLARFAIALIDGRLLNEQSRRMMWRRQKTSDGKETRYGLGFFLSGEGEALRVAHSGAQEKTRTQLLMVPARGLAVALMSNCEYAKLGGVARDVLRSLEGSER